MITSPWKWRHLKSVIVPSVQSPPSMLQLHDFCNRAGAVTLDALLMIVLAIGCQRRQRDIVDHFPVRSQGRLTELVVRERPDARRPVRRPSVGRGESDVQRLIV